MAKRKPAKAAGKPTTPTLVTFLLDRTGSMMSCRDATIEAFNAYLGGLQEEKSDGLKVEFTFLQFDSVSLDKICIAEPVRSVKMLTTSTFEPRASTPLIDSCVKTIKAVEESLTKRDDKPKIVICFQTDGHENCSTQYGWAELNQLIKEKIALGWQFNFMGAGIDAYDHAQKMGIMAESALSYDHLDKRATQSAFAASACNTRTFGIGASANTSYSASQRMSAGDNFAPSDLKSRPSVQTAPAPKKIPKKDIVDDFSL